MDSDDIVTLLHHLLSRLDAIDSRLDVDLETTLELTAPKSERAFCGVDENRDCHHTGISSRFKDPCFARHRRPICLCVFTT
ncbi:hypothetical protein ANCDUO_21408 [Ancylostoma duodenale]|uniref:Uncharacterized protein n=1 Tax=Ancylostoma duodenale TaxID=51022 RepID=A0A0C2CFG6_9BILA|nr:hypothetical protein ANCDUO_21408 [Ancylostoma duodenale]